jgi:hypothetical protein
LRLGETPHLGFGETPHWWNGLAHLEHRCPPGANQGGATNPMFSKTMRMRSPSSAQGVDEQDEGIFNRHGLVSVGCSTFAGVRPQGGFACLDSQRTDDRVVRGR